MEASKTRRKLFERTEPDHPLTSMKMKILIWLAECDLLSLPQIARITHKSEQATRNHMRDLYHLGLVERVGVNRSALTDIDDPNTPDLLSGRAPTIYMLTRNGADAIGVKLPEKLPDFGPRNSSHIAHELEIRDVRVWLELLRHHYKHAGCSLWSTETSLGRARPDAVFRYHLPKNVLVGLVETDRGTMRAHERWEDKLLKYQGAYATGSIEAATGQQKGRVIVIAPNARRRDTIAEVLANKLPTSSIPENRFWITEKSTLEGVDLLAKVWRIPEWHELMPLVEENML